MMRKASTREARSGLHEGVALDVVSMYLASLLSDVSGKFMSGLGVIITHYCRVSHFVTCD